MAGYAGVPRSQGPCKRVKSASGGARRVPNDSLAPVPVSYPRGRGSRPNEQRGLADAWTPLDRQQSPVGGRVGDDLDGGQLGVGVGLTLPAMMASATSELPPESFATGSAVVNMLRQVGLAIGVLPRLVRAAHLCRGRSGRQGPAGRFLTQISRSPVIKRGTQTGVYSLDSQAPRRLRQRLADLHPSCRARVPMRAPVIHATSSSWPASPAATRTTMPASDSTSGGPQLRGRRRASGPAEHPVWKLGVR